MLQSSIKISKWFTTITPRPEATIRLIGFPHSGGGSQSFREWDQVPNHIELFIKDIHVREHGRQHGAQKLSDLRLRAVSEKVNLAPY